MKIRNKFFLPLFFLLGLSLFSCKTKDYTPSTFKGSSISFGSGGGFTGKVNKHVLLENGQFFTNKVTKKTFDELTRFKKKEIATYFQECDKLMASTETMQEPGNLYYFIAYQKDGKLTRIVWGEKDREPNPEILNFYDKLCSLVK